jgi:hypothetical protein
MTAVAEALNRAAPPRSICGTPDEMAQDRFTPVIRHVFDDWRRRANGNAVSLRSSIDPLHLRMALPNAVLWDVHDEQAVGTLLGVVDFRAH